MKKALILLSLIAATLVSNAQNPSEISEDSIKRACDQFMDYFSKGKYHDAIELMRSNTALGKDKLDKLYTTIMNQSSIIKSSFGTPTGYQLIIDKKIKDIVIKRYYLLQLTNSYLKFFFIMYNNGKSWIITSFKYNDSIDDLLDDL